MALNLTPWKKRSAPLAPRENNEPFTSLQQEMNRLFDEFSRSFGLATTEEGFGVFAPMVNVSEDEASVVVSAELPGLEEKDIEVSVADDVLTIRGEKKEEKEDKGKNYFRMERHYGEFRREIPLPSEVEVDKVEASFKNGVLKVTLPKSKKARTEVRKIEVKK